MHALRCSVNTTLDTSPGALVCSRDMIMDVPLIVNLTTIRDRRQNLINENLIKQNSKRIEHHYRRSDMVDQIIFGKIKLMDRSHGPYRIVERTATDW